jgi:hypothetical protein
MRILVVIGFIACLGCGISGPDSTRHTTQSITCSNDEVPIYRNQFQPFAGASGVATAPEAAAGTISSDASAGAAKAPVLEGGSDGAPISAMAATCGAAPCAAGEVAVEEPSRTPMNGTELGGFTDGPSTGPAAPPTPKPTPETIAIVCTTPPPACAAGLSPQFTSKRTWECTDCSLVVTFGGIYGNYRRCVNKPTVACGHGEVPTFGLENEQWECKPTCDNGLYDQHTIDGVLVCVPC